MKKKKPYNGEYGSAKNGLKDRTQERGEAIRNLKLQGLSFAGIGKIYGVSRHTVRQWLEATEDHTEMMKAANGYCQECGCECLKLQAHHDDYSKPASRALCHSCHRQAHWK